MYPFYEIWKLIEKEPILEKYQIALVLNRKDKMDKGSEPYQSVVTLIKARNALVHFKPEWHDVQCVHEDISKRLKGKLELSPFIDDKAPVFPMQCMSHGFASWAIRSSLDFVKHWSDLSGLPNRLSRFM